MTIGTIYENIVDEAKLRAADVEAKIASSSLSKSASRGRDPNDTRCFRKNHVAMAEPHEMVPLDSSRAIIEGVRVTDRDQDRDEASHTHREAGTEAEFEAAHEEDVYDDAEAGMFADEFAVPILPTSAGGRGWK